MGADWSSIARRFLTRPPTGTPGRAISPSEDLRRLRGARAQKIISLPPLPFGFRRRPIHFSVPAAVEAGEALAGFASGIRHGGKGDGGVIKGANGLFVKEMQFGHHGE